MAPSARNAARGAAGLMLCVALGASAIGAGAPADPPPHGGGGAILSGAGGRYTISASKVEVDTRTQQAVLRDVTISQGDLRVSADRATATNFNSDNSRWTFTGSVHISSGQHGTLRSDGATVDIRNGRILSALATGHPATFEQTASKTGVLAQGHADSIEYTFATSTVRLAGNAWLEYGDNQITDPVLIYDIRQQKLRTASEAGPGERVHITILPKKRASTKPGATPGSGPKDQP